MIPLKPYRVGIILTFQSKIQNIMKSNLEREVRILKIYALATTLLFSLLLFSAFNSNRNPKFEEIDVERINIVEKDGSLTDIQVVKGIGAGCDEEAIRVLSSAPKWNPGKQRGMPVRVRKILPIKFLLQKN